MIDLTARDLEIVTEILRNHVPDCEVRAFGSRVTGNAKKFSDLDLALIGPEKLDWRKLEELRDAFSESDLPIIVDVHDWKAIPEEFRVIICKTFQTICLN